MHRQFNPGNDRHKNKNWENIVRTYTDGWSEREVPSLWSRYAIVHALKIAQHIIRDKSTPKRGISSLSAVHGPDADEESTGA